MNQRSLAMMIAVVVVAGLMGFVLSPLARSDSSGLVALLSSDGPLDGRLNGRPEETLRETREFRFEYRVEIPMPSPMAGPIHVFVPIASDTKAQKILELKIETELQGRIETEATYGNQFWHGVIAADRTETASLNLRYRVARSVLRAGDEREAGTAVQRFLAPNERVVVAHPVLAPILREIQSASKGEGKPERVRAIYDWIVDNVEYKKVGSGWGNGDTFWACSERYGNCTDFHSLFISLARTEGIPARFEMGFSIPLDREEGSVSGYHCWVEFWLPGVGWFPIDASAAFEHPEKRELFYGTQPADRFHFTTGRDLRLGPDHLDRPLNYFIYPYVEVAGRHSDLEIKTQFRYREVESREASQLPVR